MPPPRGAPSLGRQSGLGSCCPLGPPHLLHRSWGTNLWPILSPGEAHDWAREPLGGPQVSPAQEAQEGGRQALASCARRGTVPEKRGAVS